MQGVDKKVALDFVSGIHHDPQLISPNTDHQVESHL